MTPQGMDSIVSQLKAAVARRTRRIELDLSLAEASWVAHVLADALNQDRADRARGE